MSDKHSGLLGPLISLENNLVLCEYGIRFLGAVSLVQKCFKCEVTLVQIVIGMSLVQIGLYRWH